jgi:CHAT domain-containing protein
MFQSILFALFLAFSPASGENYIEQYVDRYINPELTEESLWAAGVLYYTGPEEYREALLSRIEDERIRELLLGHQELSGYFQQAGFTFHSERLILAYMLHDDSEVNRLETLETFYQDRERNGLYELNRMAATGTKWSEGVISDGNIGFEYFLVSFHVSSNNISSDEMFQQVLNYWKNNLNRESENLEPNGFVLATLLKAFYELGEYSHINSVYEQIHLLDQLPNSRLKLNILWGAEFALYRLSHIDKSLHIQRTYTLPISKYLQNNSLLYSIQASKGGYLYQIGRYQEAKDIFLKILDQSDSLPENFQVSLFNNLSLIYYKTGESNEYVDTQLRALEIAQKSDNYSLQSRVFRNLHVFYRNYQNWNLAKEYIEKALSLAQETDNVEDLITIHTSSAVFSEKYLNDREEAYSHLSIAQNLLNEDIDQRIHIRVMSEKSNLLLNDGKYHESLTILNEIKRASTGQSDISTYLEAVLMMAKIKHTIDDFSRLKELLREYRMHDASNLDFQPLIQAQVLKAELSRYLGNDSQADQLFSDTAELVFERSHNTSEPESGYWAVEDEYLYLFQRFADFLVERGETHRALNLFDRIKTINDASLTENPLVQSAHLSETELTRLRNLSDEMDRLRRQILLADGSRQLSLQNELERLNAERRSLMAEVSPNSIRPDIPVRTIQRQLRPDELLLHITEVGDRLYMAEIRRSGIDIRKLAITPEMEELFVAASESVITGRSDLEKLYEIGQLIDIESLVDRAGSLIVMPGGYFHQIPLNILPLRKPASPFSYGSASYVIEHSDVRYLNSLRDLVDRSSRGRFASDYSGFGVSDFQNDITSRNLVSLPKAPSEITAISERLHRLGSRDSFINYGATVEQFQQSAGSSRILHMATHSEISESDPLFSTIHFYADEPEADGQVLTGRLFAYELFDLNLNNDLIMLNSCESGGDRYIQGTGIMGISRALRYAGAQSLVLNSWSVNDHYAADFAETFYSYLNEGETKSDALRLTQIEFIQTRNANPHFWGPYILNGDNRPVIHRPERRQGTLLLAILFVTGLVLTGYRKRSEAA